MNIENSVSMYDIAKAAQVSQSTVSRVMRQRAGISAKTRELVLKTMRDLGYKSDVTNLLYPEEKMRKRVSVLMCPLPEQQAPMELQYFQSIVSGITDYFANSGVETQLEILPANAASSTYCGDMDGAILLGVPSRELRSDLRRRGCPCVIISDDIYSSEEEMVTVDRYEASAACCRSLLDSGVTRIGFLLSELHMAQSDGFICEMIRRHIPVNDEMVQFIPTSDIVGGMIDPLQRWIDGKMLPQVLVVSFGAAASVVGKIFRINKIRVPEDVRIITFSRHPGVRHEYSVIESHPYEMGRSGAKKMLYRFAHPDESPEITIIPMTFETITPRKIVDFIQTGQPGRSIPAYAGLKLTK